MHLKLEKCCQLIHTLMEVSCKSPDPLLHRVNLRLFWLYFSFVLIKLFSSIFLSSILLDLSFLQAFRERFGSMMSLLALFYWCAVCFNAAIRILNNKFPISSVSLVILPKTWHSSSWSLPSASFGVPVFHRTFSAAYLKAFRWLAQHFVVPWVNYVLLYLQWYFTSKSYKMWIIFCN